MITHDRCQWAIDNNVSNPNCHKDFCACSKKSLSLAKTKSNDRKWTIFENACKELDKKGIPYKQIGSTRSILIGNIMTFYTLDNEFTFKGNNKRYSLGNKKKAYEFIERIVKQYNLI